ncbi:MAG: hypothetical protein F6K40_12430 [Okeania sp. SIO3I5]|nr:hypothetical protein [Okeania sp. SIO3I5]
MGNKVFLEFVFLTGDKPAAERVFIILSLDSVLCMSLFPSLNSMEIILNDKTALAFVGTIGRLELEYPGISISGENFEIVTLSMDNVAPSIARNL